MALLLARIQSKETRLSIIQGRINRTQGANYDRETSMVELQDRRRATTAELQDKLMKQQKLIKLRSDRLSQLIPVWKSTQNNTEINMERDRENLRLEFEDRKKHLEYELLAVHTEYNSMCDAVPKAIRAMHDAIRRTRRAEIGLELMSESLSMWRDHKLHSAVEREFLMQVSELNRLRNLISHLQAEKLLLTEDETRAIAQRNVLKRAMDNQKQLDHIADRVETWNNSPLKEERGGDKKTDSNNNQSNEAEKVNGKKQNATSILKISLNEKRRLSVLLTQSGGPPSHMPPPPPPPPQNNALQIALRSPVAKGAVTKGVVNSRAVTLTSHNKSSSNNNSNNYNNNNNNNNNPLTLADINGNHADRTFQNLLDNVITDVSTAKGSNSLKLVDVPHSNPPSPPSASTTVSTNAVMSTKNNSRPVASPLALVTSPRFAPPLPPSQSTLASSSVAVTLTPQKNRPPPPRPSTLNKSLRLTNKNRNEKKELKQSPPTLMNNRRGTVDLLFGGINVPNGTNIPNSQGEEKETKYSSSIKTPVVQNRRSTVDLLFG